MILAYKGDVIWIFRKNLHRVQMESILFYTSEIPVP